MNRLTKLNKHNEWAISLEDVSHVLSGNRYDTGDVRFRELTGDIADRLALYEELGKSPQELLIIIEDYENMKRQLEKVRKDLEIAQNATAIMKLKYLEAGKLISNLQRLVTNITAAFNL